MDMSTIGYHNKVNEKTMKYYVWKGLRHRAKIKKDKAFELTSEKCNLP